MWVTSSIKTLLARIIKAIMVVIVLSAAIGLLGAILDQLEMVSVSGVTIREWLVWGFLTYVGIHVLLYRPTGLFRAGRSIFSAIAVWLFGSQVASVEGSQNGRSKGSSGKKEGKSDPAAQGSTLVAFSPYVVPVFTVLVCIIGWLMNRWFNRALLDGPISFCIGLTIAFHWLMTADELQQQRKRWHVETYLLALSLVFVLTMLLSAAVLPIAIPEFSFLRALSDGMASTQELLTYIFHRLFI